MLKLEAVHKLIKAQLEGRVAELEARASRLAKRSAQQAQRRALDMEVRLGMLPELSGECRGRGD